MVDTEIWDKSWFMSLPPRLKCAVEFIRAKCDLAGVWDSNFTLMSACIGEAVTESEVLMIDGGRQFIKMACGKIFCDGFIQFQNGPNLSPQSPIHKKIIGLLYKHGISHDPVKSSFSFEKYPIDTLFEKPDRVYHTPVVGVGVGEEVGIGGGVEVKPPEIKKKKAPPKAESPESNAPRIIQPHQAVGSVWSEFMLQATQSEFKWPKAEMTALVGITSALTEKLTNLKAGSPPDQEALCLAWNHILSNRSLWPTWLAAKWDLNTINKYFDEIYTSVKNGKPTNKTGSGNGGGIDPQKLLDARNKKFKELGIDPPTAE